MVDLDWEKIRADYEAGSLNNSEIARKYNCSEAVVRKWAKAKGWLRDLNPKVAQTVRVKLVRESVRAEKSISDQQYIDAASNQIVEIAQRDRELLERLETILRGLLDELQYVPTEEAALKRLIEIDAPHDQVEIVKEMRKMTLTLEKRTALIKTMSEVTERLIKLHRLCYGMDASPADTPGNILADVLAVIATRNNRCLPGSVDSL